MKRLVVVILALLTLGCASVGEMTCFVPESPEYQGKAKK